MFIASTGLGYRRELPIAELSSPFRNDDDAPMLLISSYGNDQRGTRRRRLREFCRPYPTMWADPGKPSNGGVYKFTP
jgi:hypothetical protein